MKERLKILYCIIFCYASLHSQTKLGSEYTLRTMPNIDSIIDRCEETIYEDTIVETSFEDNGIKYVKHPSIETGKALVFASGLRRTRYGSAVITPPEYFINTVCKNRLITVHLTPEGLPVVLYVVKKKVNRVSVSMKVGDYINYGDTYFSYQLIGFRKEVEDTTNTTKTGK